ncbi:hypothetical protein QE152_g24627, partial [Popillia japonica]
EG